MTTLSSGRGRLERTSRRGGFLIATGAALVAALAFALVHGAHADAVVAVVLLPAAAWLLSRSYGGLVLGLVLILVLPEWHTFGTSNITAIRLASVAAASTLLVNRRIRLHRIDLALLALVLITVAGWLLQYHRPHSGRVVSNELWPIGFYLGARALPKARMQLVLRVVLYAGTIGALTVIYEYLRGHAIFVDPLTYDWNAKAQSIFRPGGIWGSPPGASTVLTFVILFGLACLVTERGRRRAMYAVCVSLCAVALVLTFTRAGIIATAVGALVFLWLIHSPLLRALRVAWAAVAVGLVLVVIIPTLAQSKAYQEGILRGGTLAAREGYWSFALPVATANAHNLFLGIGTGALEIPTTRGSGGFVPAYIAVAPDLINNSLHSQYVTVLVEQGLLGLAALAVFLALCIVPMARAAWVGRDPLAAAIATSILGFAIVCSTDTELLHDPSLAMLMFASGLAASLLSARRPLRAQQDRLSMRAPKSLRAAAE
jgi:O-antigen ligase